MNLSETLADTGSNVAYQFKRGFFYITGKQASGTISGLASGLSPSLASLMTMGLASAVSASLTQMDYNRKNQALIHFYRDELSAKVHKNGGRLTKDDLDLLARGDVVHNIEANGVVDEALTKNRRARNVGVVLSVLATLSALAIVGVAAHFGMFAGMAPAADWLAHGFAGLLSYNAVKTPLHWLGDKLFGFDEKTAHDHIAGIYRDRHEGKAISREQVFAVFVAAHPELSEVIENRYGRKFDALDIALKREVVEQMSSVLPVDELTNNINSGRMRVAELAFAVEGQQSGVDSIVANAPARPGLFKSITGKILHPLRGREQVTPQVAAERVIMEYAPQERPARSFVSRFGHMSRSTDLGHVEQLEQSRSELPPIQR